MSVNRVIGHALYISIAIGLVLLLAHFTVMTIQESIAVLVFGFGAFEFNRWRRELVGTEEVNLTLQIGELVIRIRDTFRVVRNPTRPAVDEEGLEDIHKLLNELYPLRARAEFIWDTNIDDEVKAFNGKFSDLRLAMIDLDSSNEIKASKGRDPIDVRYYTGENDVFMKNLDGIIESIKRKLKPKIR